MTSGEHVILDWIKAASIGAVFGFILAMLITESDDAPAVVYRHSYPTVVEQAAAFAEPAQPLPENGAVEFYVNDDQVAPFSVQTQAGSQHYYLKILRASDMEPVATLFVRSGESAQIQMPLGSYVLHYATGKTWYGKEYLFGPETIRSKADQPFAFRDTGDAYEGYTLDLVQQEGGNLATSHLPPDQW